MGMSILLGKRITEMGFDFFVVFFLLPSMLPWDLAMFHGSNIFS
jgi:hypothetical protein